MIMGRSIVKEIQALGVLSIPEKAEFFQGFSRPEKVNMVREICSGSKSSGSEVCCKRILLKNQSERTERTAFFKIP
jgi:hypothetical protein